MATTKQAPAPLSDARPSQKNGAESGVHGSDNRGNGHAPRTATQTGGLDSLPQPDAARAQAGSVAPDGATLRRGPKLSKAANVRLQFARTYRQLVTGEIDERKATARARILEGALAAIESTKLEARLNALEKERKAAEEAKV